MKIRLFIMLIGIAGCYLARGQHLKPTSLTPAGEVSKTNAITLEWTLGEIAAESVYTDLNMYTQGFNQPVLLAEKLEINNPVLHHPKESEAAFKIDVFPNPVTAYLTIRSNRVSNPIGYHLLDLNGKMISQGEVPGGLDTHQLEMKNYPSATYFLHFIDAENQIFETYKIIKN